MIQNLIWSGVYLRITLSNTIIQKVRTLVPMTANGTEVFVYTMTTFISDYYDALEETLTHMKSIKIRIYTGDNVTYRCAAILVDYERF